MELNYVIIGLGLVFAATGFLITESNARILLAGYNTMPRKKQQRFDLKRYIPFVRNLHLILGVTYILFGLAINTLNNQTYTAAFMVVYPLLIYFYLLLRRNDFWKD